MHMHRMRLFLPAMLMLHAHRYCSIFFFRCVLIRILVLGCSFISSIASGLAASVAVLHHLRPRIIYAPRLGYHMTRLAMTQYKDMCGDGVVKMVTEEQVKSGGTNVEACA